MREIIFRAYDKEDGEMFAVNVLVFNPKSFSEGAQFYWPEPYFLDQHNDIHPLKDCELMQYTGFISCEGDLVYEGDIVKDGNGNIYAVRKCGGTGKQDAGFGKFEAFECCKKYRDGLWSMHEYPLRFAGMKVIGNIYDNPELLEVAE